MKKSLFFMHLLISSINCLSQGGIGYSESELRSQFANKPNLSIYENYTNGIKSLIVIDLFVASYFSFDNQGGKCMLSMLQFKQPEGLQYAVHLYDSTMTIVKKGKIWHNTAFDGSLVKIELGYMNSIKSAVIYYSLIK